MLRAALLSRWHPHAEKPDERYVKEFLSQPGCAVQCVWDRDEETAAKWAAEYGVDYSTDLEKVISRKDVDCVIVTSNPADHREIFSLAAKYQKHIFTEKVLSFELEDALAIREIVKSSGVQFGIAFTRLGIPQLAYAKKLIDQGTLGTPVLFRCLCGHALGVKNMLPDYWYDPAQTGGGAMIDMGFNSAYLAQYVMGNFESVSASFRGSVLGKAVEDCASCNVFFKNGAMGLIDATFDSPSLSVFELSVYGTLGAYYARFGGADMAELHIEGQPREHLDLSALPRDVEPPVTTWVKACLTGSSIGPYGIDNAVELVKFMNAAYQSHRENGLRKAI